MTSGRIFVLGLLLSGLVAGVAMYWLQVHAFYEEVPAGAAQVRLTSVATGAPEPVEVRNFRGIDSESSPIRYRACFELDESLAELTERYVIHERPEPLVAPGWFGCFDAQAIGNALESGRARAFLGVENLEYGIDRVVAVDDTGRAFAWNQINACGEVVFEGDPAPEGCPPPPESLN